MLYDSVAFSGLPGSGKTTLTRILSDRIGWSKVSAGDYLRERHRKEMPEVSFEEFYRGIPLEDLDRLNEWFVERAKQGRVIADTRHVHIIGANTLKIFVTASLGIRAARADLKKYLGKTREEIPEILRQRELDEVRKAQERWPAYNYRDPRHYQAIIDTERMTPEEEADCVMYLLGDLE